MRAVLRLCSPRCSPRGLLLRTLRQESRVSLSAVADASARPTQRPPALPPVPAPQSPVPVPGPSSAVAGQRDTRPAAGPSEEQRRANKTRLQTAMRTALAQSSHDQVLQLWQDARDAGIELDAQDLDCVLTACAMTTRKSLYFRHVRYVSEEVFLALAASKTVPLDAFDKLVSVARALQDPLMALDLYRSYGKLYGCSKGCERVAYAVLETVAFYCSTHSAEKARAARLQMSLCEMFGDACALMDAGSPKLSDAVFANTALAFSQLGLTNQLMQTLVEMTKAKIKPSLALCDKLLVQALWHSDTTVLKVLLGWYLNDFFRSLDAGQTDRLMHIAAYRGDQAAARLGLKMLAQAGRAPSLLHYVCWTRACLNAQDVNGAIEALLEAQAQGLSLLDSAHGHALQTLLGDCFKSTTANLDSIYFALVDLRRSGYSIPPAALNGVILAAGKLSQLDRAFGTFREYKSLFGVRPDLHAHNALLAAVLASKFPQVEAMLSIFEDMEGAGLEPCEASYSLLLAAMAETGDMTSYDEVAAYMRKQGRGPSPRALRRVCLRLARDGQQGRLDEALALMSDVTGEAPPLFLRKRLDSLLAKTKPAAGADADNDSD